MTQGMLAVNPIFTRGEVSARIFGSFAEHMGRVIYSGIYEPGHPAADETGCRSDVLQAVRDMGVTLMRYPGGNFVSNYRWENGVGPVGERPRQVDLAWRSIETNEFGTNEFMRWAAQAGMEPMLTVNLGTRGLTEALEYLEYVNFPGGTPLSDLRRAHGVREPYGVKLWCLGNEMDGSWQIGHKDMESYARLAAETGKAMKILDPSIELIACGSAKSDMPTFPRWDLCVLEHVYGIADYLSLHQYYGGQQQGTAAFLAQSEDFESYIATIRSAIAVIRALRRSDKAMYISVDEWGVWAEPPESVTQEVDQQPWQVAPAISEQIYTLEDALLFASMLMTMVRNADIVKIGCQSLITNISSCIMTRRGGEMWKQTTYYPFQMLARHARGTVLEVSGTHACYAVPASPQVPTLDVLAVWNRAEGEVAVFCVNRLDNAPAELSLQLQGFAPTEVAEFTTLTGSAKQTNEADHSAVIPRESDAACLRGGVLTASLPPLSFSMIRVNV